MDADGKKMLERGARFLDLVVGGRAFDVSVDSFFQGNRFLVPDLFADVAAEAGRAEPGTALDAFGGVGLFAGALAEAGHRVVSVEADAEAVTDARRTKDRWPDGGRWEIEGPVTLARFLQEDDRRFACVVADPPRAGLGTIWPGRSRSAARSSFSTCPAIRRRSPATCRRSSRKASEFRTRSCTTSLP